MVDRRCLDMDIGEYNTDEKYLNTKYLNTKYLYSQHRYKVSYMAKRLFDTTFSLLALIVLSPVMLGTALAIAIEDGRPILYRQSRIGKDKKEFSIYKFRSMRKDADQIHEDMRKEYGCTEVSFKLKDDPRITRVGKFIRATNIDELPQLINIIKGDMSLVGPRPLPTYEFEDEQKRYNGIYDERYTVPQGLTCYWQVADRASVDFDKRMEMDVRYARDRGMLTDVKLIIKTIIFTLTGRAAY
jgi:lipopolysaccharide/colanic/teichoic acid biosynthesis glycosyltransferase